MGYHIALLRSPPRPISWTELTRAARKPAWEPDEGAREAWLHGDDRLVARVVCDKDGEPWSKPMREKELAHRIVLDEALGARARGDESERYRNVNDWYFHPGDRAERDGADAARITVTSSAARLRRRRFRFIGLFPLAPLGIGLSKAGLQ